MEGELKEYHWWDRLRYGAPMELKFTADSEKNESELFRRLWWLAVCWVVEGRVGGAPFFKTGLVNPSVLCTSTGQENNSSTQKRISQLLRFLSHFSLFLIV